MKELLERLIKEITPTKEEHKNELEIVDEVKDLLRVYDVKPILVGSLEKGTDLRGNKDLDIFIQFKQDVSRKDLEKKALDIGKKVFKQLKVEHEIDYAEHPYVKGFYREHDIEIVPCYEGKEIMSSVDRTPLHTEYIKGKIKTSKKIRGEIRLMKQFMKGVNVYGAEAKVEGFSGYLVELLVLHYKTFQNTLKAASSWDIPEVIDIEKQWEDAESLKYFFTQASLIVVDPVDKNRNVAAAVSKEKLATFIVAATEFLKKPSRDFFFPKEIKPKSKEELEEIISSRETKFIALTIKHKKLNENTLYSQLKKTTNSIVDEIEKQEFKVFKSSYWTNEKDMSVILLEMEVWNLPEVKHHKGPPVDIDPVNQEKFVEKYKKDKPYIKDGRWVVDTKREITETKNLLKKIVEAREGFGKNLREAEKIGILEDKKMLEIENEDWRRHLTKYLQ